LDAEALRKQVSAEKMRAEKFEREAQVIVFFHRVYFAFSFSTNLFTEMDLLTGAA
jgi:hypothetical protein